MIIDTSDYYPSKQTVTKVATGVASLAVGYAYTRWLKYEGNERRPLSCVYPEVSSVVR